MTAMEKFKGACDGYLALCRCTTGNICEQFFRGTVMQRTTFPLKFLR